MCALPTGPTRRMPTTDAVESAVLSVSLHRLVHCLALSVIASLFPVTGHLVNGRLRRSLA